MKTKLILVPIDFTPISEAVLETAVNLARGSGGKLLIVHVREARALADNLEYLYAYPDLTAAQLGEKLKAIVPAGGGAPYEHRLLEGTPVEAILAVAEAENVDMIVLGTHGRRGISRVLMGSVAEAVVRRAKCPVLAVKAAAKEVVLTS